MENKIIFLNDIEVNILKLIEKRFDKFSKSVNDTDLNNTDIVNIINYSSLFLRDKDNIIDEKYILERLNWDIYSKKKIIKTYISLFNNRICIIDADIINLIIKYIIECGKIIKTYKNKQYGIIECNLDFTMIIKSLSADYIINKYYKKSSYAIKNCNYVFQTTINIFINIIQPFGIEYLNIIYYQK